MDNCLFSVKLRIYLLRTYNTLSLFSFAQNMSNETHDLLSAAYSNK
jgi:hypothetical protein